MVNTRIIFPFIIKYCMINFKTVFNTQSYSTVWAPIPWIGPDLIGMANNTLNFRGCFIASSGIKFNIMFLSQPQRIIYSGFGPVWGGLEQDEWNVIISVISFFLSVKWVILVNGLRFDQEIKELYTLTSRSSSASFLYHFTPHIWQL